MTTTLTTKPSPPKRPTNVWKIVTVFLAVFTVAIVLVESNPPSDSAYATNRTIYASIPTESGRQAFLKQSANLTRPVRAELVDLDRQVISCGSDVEALLSDAHTFGGSCLGNGGAVPSIAGLTLGGQCCGAMMDTDEYHENLRKLQAYRDVPGIPLDPMHTPIATAKAWIEYDRATTLSPDEQQTYDQARSVSKEGPCCCKCWHYYVNEGIAKKMMKSGAFTAQQVAAFWDVSDICG